jgi:hypothetical protein
MADNEARVTIRLPADVLERLNAECRRLDRSQAWVIRHALEASLPTPSTPVAAPEPGNSTPPPTPSSPPDSTPRARAGDGARPVAAKAEQGPEPQRKQVKARRVRTTGQSGLVMTSYEATVDGQQVKAMRESHLRERAAEIDPGVELVFD